jgi:hypothetical protein
MQVPEEVAQLTDSINSKGDQFQALMEQAHRASQDTPAAPLIAQALYLYQQVFGPQVVALLGALFSSIAQQIQAAQASTQFIEAFNGYLHSSQQGMEALDQRVRKLEQVKEAMIEHLEDLEDRIEVHDALEEMELTGERPKTLEEVERELDAAAEAA